MKNLASAMLIWAFATGAFAHSSIETTQPENGATVAEAPAEISVTFVKKIRLTRVEMTFDTAAPVRLDLGDQKSFDRTFTLPLETMGAGTYRIEWRGLGADGHAMQGDFMFMVD
jgi:methionine-rich copper-binding protein CopC